jgi:hypothetical protein
MPFQRRLCDTNICFDRVQGVAFAELMPKPGQKIAKALPICEKTLIRYYLAQRHGLVNIQGTNLRFHELDSNRPDLKNFLPLRTKIQIQ